MTKKTVIALSLLLITALSRAESYNCNAEDMKHFAYCTYITGPANTNKFVKTLTANFSGTSCMNTTNAPLSITKNSIERGSTPPGKHTFSFSQCDSIFCDNEVPLAEDTLTVLPNKTVDHSQFSFALNPLFGENCNRYSFYEQGFMSGVPKAICEKFAYCAKMKGPESVKKFVKVIQDKGISFTYCVNSAFAYAYDTYKPAKSVSHTLHFFQCDTVACKNQKLLGTDTFVFSSDGKIDHNEFTFSLDPNFGTSC